ncbi:MAG: hypothetical protein ACE5IK_04865 [Acidobacteriota bacterium]
MWVIVLGLGALFLAIFLLLALLSPKGENRPLVFTCQRCDRAFGTPPLHPLPERYQETDLCLCETCSEDLEERVKNGVRRIQADFLAEEPPRRVAGDTS